jgi:hypothetical protein
MCIESTRPLGRINQRMYKSKISTVWFFLMIIYFNKIRIKIVEIRVFQKSEKKEIDDVWD